MRRADESGFSLVESVMAIAVLAIVMVPTIHLVIEGQLTTNEQRIEAEASTMATQAVQKLQDEVQQGIMPNGSTQQTVTAGNDRFTVRVAFTATSSGTSSTFCTSANGGIPGTWIATATVTWHGMTGAAPVVATTELAPGIAGALDGASGTIAVPILNPSGTAFADPSVPVTVTLTGTWTQGPGTAASQPAVPQGEITSGSVNTTNGCAVFLGVDPDPGWTYTVSVNNIANSAAGGPAELINSSQESYDNPTHIPALGPYAVQVGEPTLAGAFYLAEAAPVSVSFSSPVAAATGVPVTASNAGNNVVFSTLSGGSIMYLFPYTTAYGAWAGDMAQSNPAATCGAVACYPGAAAAPAIDATAGTASSVSLPLYDLALAQSGAAKTTQLTATDAASPGTVFQLSAPSGTGASATGMPLGQYLIDSSPVKYVWVTPTGMCSSATLMATTCGSPSFTAVTVT